MPDLSKIHKGMDVLTADDHCLGKVREMLGQVLFLDSAGDVANAQGNPIQMIWIIDIDSAVRLAKTKEQVQKEWQHGAPSKPV